MINIFKLEFKRIIKSPLFYIIAILIISFAISQIGLDIDPGRISKPEIGLDSYGMYTSSDMEIIKPRALDNLILEYRDNYYTTYPYGFYKAVRLSEKKDIQIGEIISALTGESFEEIEKIKTHSNTMDDILENIGLRKDLSNGEFKELMNLADTIIGKGSYYGDKHLVGMFGRAEKDYDRAIEDYNLIIEEDKISGAYARIFADYIGIALGLLPVFLSVGIWYLDKSSKSRDVLYVRQVKSKDMVWGRYLAMVVLLSIIILALATYYNIKVISQFGIKNIDVFAYYKYTLIWLIPTMMVSVGLGTLLTILTDSPLGILIQLAWWFLDVNSKYEGIQGGGYGMSLILRHNIVGNTLVYMNNINQILINRLVYIFLALAMVAIGERIYNRKRVGRLGGINEFRKAK